MSICKTSTGKTWIRKRTICKIWTGFAKVGFVKRGFVKCRFVKRALVKHGFVKYGLVRKKTSKKKLFVLTTNPVNIFYKSSPVQSSAKQLLHLQYAHMTQFRLALFKAPQAIDTLVLISPCVSSVATISHVQIMRIKGMIEKENDLMPP